MHIITFSQYQNKPASVVTIGNFDGLHRGHQKLISEVNAQAASLGAKSTVMLFEPQPMEFFCPHCAPARLMSLSNKLIRLKELGVDQVAILTFNQRLAHLSASNFVKQLLINKLNAKAVWVGDDFRFGKGRSGDFNLMQSLGQQYHFSVSQTPSLVYDGRRVSSTWIRESLIEGNIPLAEQLLGSAYRIIGRVVHGQKLGRQLGFPTMNIHFRKQLAVSGVFAVMIKGLSSQNLFGIANLGIRPSITGNHQQRLEVNVFDWQGSAYGKKIEVIFYHRLRSEQRFNSLEELKTQICTDVYQAKAWWQEWKTTSQSFMD